jgi:hypothetical protein
MADNNELFFKQASDLLSKIEIRYMQADFDEQIELKDERDRAMTVYSQARLAILKQNVACTDADIQKMKELRRKIDRSPDILQVVSTVASFAVFMRSRFLL